MLRRYGFQIVTYARHAAPFIVVCCCYTFTLIYAAMMRDADIDYADADAASPDYAAHISDYVTIITIFYATLRYWYFYAMPWDYITPRDIDAALLVEALLAIYYATRHADITLLRWCAIAIFRQRHAITLRHCMLDARPMRDAIYALIITAMPYYAATPLPSFALRYFSSIRRWCHTLHIIAWCQPWRQDAEMPFSILHAPHADIIFIIAMSDRKAITMSYAMLITTPKTCFHYAMPFYIYYLLFAAAIAVYYDADELPSAEMLFISSCRHRRRHDTAINAAHTDIAAWFIFIYYAGWYATAARHAIVVCHWLIRRAILVTWLRHWLVAMPLRHYTPLRHLPRHSLMPRLAITYAITTPHYCPVNIAIQ